MIVIIFLFLLIQALSTLNVLSLSTPSNPMGQLVIFLSLFHGRSS